MESTLLIPALSGNYQNWPFFEIILKVKEIVANLGTIDNPNYRIKTTDEVEVIYSQAGINNLLQRVLDIKRLEPIRKFINEQPDAYLNNLTLAIYGGNPQWVPVDLKKSSLHEDISDTAFEDIANTYGLIKLTGDETLFVLDGQHRLKSLRLAFEKNPNIGEYQMGLTLVAHIDNEEGKKKTRRLFSIINRYAKPVSLGESILLDEDDVSAIIVRRFIEEYSPIVGKEIIALNKTADLKLPKDKGKFTTVIALWNVNEILIDPKKVYPKYIGSKFNLVRIRPNDATIDSYKNDVFAFWDTFFQCFPAAEHFIQNPILHPRISGGPLSLRPIGQQVFGEYYLKMKELNRLAEVDIIKIIPDDINDSFWHYVLFDPIGQRIIGNRAFVRDYVFYHLNLPLTHKQLSSLLKNYRKLTQSSEADLPVKLISN